MGRFRGQVNSNNIMVSYYSDENQSGQFNEELTWCNFTFDSFPVSDVVISMDNPERMDYLYKVVNNEIVARTQAEVDADRS